MISRLPTRLSLALALALLAFHADPAAATPADEKAARALFKVGNDRLDEGDFVGALDKFRAAYQRWPNAKILLNTAAALRKLGRFAEAADTYARYLADPATDPARKSEVETLLAELDAGLARLRIPAAEPPRRVTLDGRDLGEAAQELRVDPGPHVVIGESVGLPPIVVKLDLAAAEVRDIYWNAAAPVATGPTTDGGGDGDSGDPGSTTSVDGALPPDTIPSVTRAAAPRLSARTWPLELTRRPVVLPRGMWDLQLQVNVDNSTPYNNGRPSAFAPRIHYGVTDQLTLGITHRYGLCWNSANEDCYKTYDDFTLDGRLSLWRRGPGIAAALHPTVEFAQLDPVLNLGLNLGVLLHARVWRFGVRTDPAMRIGLAGREESGFRELISLPLELEFQVVPRVALTSSMVLAGPLDHFGDYYTFATGGGVTFTVSPHCDLALRYVLDNLREAADVDLRTLELLVALRL